jgi:lipopolysaccharide biosynthesis glycosyltransferase
MDSDMLCLADVTELFALDLEPYALRVVKHAHEPAESVKMGGKPQTRYPRKNWSSLMLLNCPRLTAWTKENVETRAARWLHRFEPIPDESIGDLPAEWNALDRCDPGTKVIHYTGGGPWLSAYANHPCAAAWFKHRDALKS